jgi:hypothetical protein
VTQDRCCVLAFGPRRDRKASNAWAMRIPTLRTIKNTAITSNIDGPCAIDALTKRSTFCTVKEIQLSELNFPPRDDFEQHHVPRRTMIVRRRFFPFRRHFMSAREPEPSRPPASPGRPRHRHPARRSRRVNPSRAGSSQALTSPIMHRWNGANGKE